MLKEKIRTYLEGNVERQKHTQKLAEKKEQEKKKLKGEGAEERK